MKENGRFQRLKEYINDPAVNIKERAFIMFSSRVLSFDAPKLYTVLSGVQCAISNICIKR